MRLLLLCVTLGSLMSARWKLKSPYWLPVFSVCVLSTNKATPKAKPVDVAKKTKCNYGLDYPFHWKISNTMWLLSHKTQRTRLAFVRILRCRCWLLSSPVTIFTKPIFALSPYASWWRMVGSKWILLCSIIL